jgi:hypothetical protein
MRPGSYRRNRAHISVTLPASQLDSSKAANYPVDSALLIHLDKLELVSPSPIFV